jgi:general secretion pathway protein C
LLNTLATSLVEPARWLAVFGIAYTLAMSVLFFVSGPAGSALTMSSGTSASPLPAPTANSVNAILSRNLFGVAGATAAIDGATAEVETRLPLQLLGVFVAEQGSANADSAAIVAQKGKPGELYQIGDLLPGNAELIEVHPQHIVLRRAGARETLRFPDVAQLQLANAPESNIPDKFAATTGAVGRQVASNRTPRELIDAYRDRLSEDPQRALDDLGIAPVSVGSSQGYRLDNLAQSPYLSQTGLQPGDIILSVNGQAVGDIRQDQKQIDNILAQGSARLEVQRGNRRFFITASLN